MASTKSSDVKLPVEWVRHSTELESITAAAKRHLLHEVSTNPGMSKDDFLVLYCDVTHNYGQLAADSAGRAVVKSRARNKLLAELPEVKTHWKGVHPSQAQGNIKWALNASKVKWKNFDRVWDTQDNAAVLAANELISQGSFERSVLKGARDTVKRATDEAKTRYYRIPSPGACSFCLMLAGRGAVYTTYETAIGSLHTSGIGRYHDHCRCVAAEGYYTQGSNPDNKYAYELPLVVQRLGEKWARIAEVAGGSITAQEQLWKRITAAEFAGNDKDVWIERIGHDIPTSRVRHENAYTAEELRSFGLATNKPGESRLIEGKNFLSLYTGEKIEYCRELGQLDKKEKAVLVSRLKLREEFRQVPIESREFDHVISRSPDYFVGNETAEAKALETFYSGDKEYLLNRYTRRFRKMFGDGAEQSDVIVSNARGGDIDREIAKEALIRAIRSEKHLKKVFFLGKDSRGYYNYVWD